MNPERGERHGQKGKQINTLRRALSNPADGGQQRNQKGAAAHTHAAQHSARNPAQKKNNKTHNIILIPAINISAEKINVVIFGFKSLRSFAPANPPSSTPIDTGSNTEKGISP